MTRKFGGVVLVRAANGDVEVVIADGTCHGRIEAGDVGDVARLLFAWVGNGHGGGQWDFGDEVE